MKKRTNQRVFLSVSQRVIVSFVFVCLSFFFIFLLNLCVLLFTFNIVTGRFYSFNKKTTSDSHVTSTLLTVRGCRRRRCRRCRRRRCALPSMAIIISKDMTMRTIDIATRTFMAIEQQQSACNEEMIEHRRITNRYSNRRKTRRNERTRPVDSFVFLSSKGSDDDASINTF
jgi:hypothetical protein